MHAIRSVHCLEKRIEILRTRLHAAFANSNGFLDAEVYRLSTKLDVAIVQYQQWMKVPDGHLEK